MKKIFFIINPSAGKGQIRNLLLDIIDIFSKAEFKTEIYTTQCRNDAYNCIKDKGAEYDMIIACCMYTTIKIDRISVICI